MTPEQHAQVKRLFADAIAVPKKEREKLLVEAGADDQVRQEVLSLLAFHSTDTILPGNGSTAHDTATQVAAPAATKLGAPDKQRLQQFRAFSVRKTSPNYGTLATLGPGGHLAIGILVSCLILGLVGLATNFATDHATRELRESKLRSSLATTVHAMRSWIEQEKLHATLITQDPELRRASAELAALGRTESGIEAIRSSPAQQAIHQQLRGMLGPEVRFALWDRRFITISDWTDDATGVGESVTAFGGAILTRVFDGEIIVQVPGIREPITKNYPLEPYRPRVSVLAPIRDEHNTIQAAILLYNLDAESRFNEILAMMKIGRTGEAFAFDRNGLVLSESRFGEELTKLQLLPQEARGNAALRLYARDPGVNLTKAARPNSSPDTWPPTKMALLATRGQSGIDLDGYRSYLGVVVVGAWQWLPEHDFGIASEISVDEVNAPLRYMHFKSIVVYGLVAGSLLLTVLSRQRLHQARRNVGIDSRLGPYVLEEQIGEGGMGVVYRGRHELLKRPTAIKMLKAEVTNARTVHWFEREVQLASQLTHPNTIEIYDYGITAEGIFFYAMEFINGPTLAELVRDEGPIEPGRAVYLLRQMAASLREAHHAGMVHRDIKPQNIMVCERGGEPDVVKVLDFGLVKPVQAEAEKSTTMLAGTPMYMSPERIKDPRVNDVRSDIYAWGAVAFFLLTGRPIFSEDSDGNLLEQILFDVPPRASSVAPHPIPPNLDALIADCLEKEVEQRPASMQVVLERLEVRD